MIQFDYDPWKMIFQVKFIYPAALHRQYQNWADKVAPEDVTISLSWQLAAVFLQALKEMYRL
jgi:hypothetical protein